MCWEKYVERIRAAHPIPSILGITDYFIPRAYSLFLERVNVADIPGLHLVFPNIELRLNIKTDRGQAVNVHLLVSPDDPAHLELITGKLQSLVFRYEKEDFRCSIDDLRRLGRMHSKKPDLDDEAALRQGAGQFLVEFRNFAELKNDSWIARNVLFAVAAGNDGLAGLSKDSGFHAHREELSSIADIIFSGQPRDRSFWLGEHPDFLQRRYAVKPCLHGSDAHNHDAVLRPAENRLCWIRAQPTFDGLRQTLVEPERRVHIGPDRPHTPAQTNLITRIRFTNAPWIQPNVIELNPGLVTIIGARGSGKTALADLIALAADASEPRPGPASFVRRAGQLLSGLQVRLEWGDGTEMSRTFGAFDEYAEPRVRYLSQQFVERLSAQAVRRKADATQPLVHLDDPDAEATAADDELLQEIERVIFDAIPTEDRLLCSSFRDLRETQLGGYSKARTTHDDTIRSRTVLVAEDQELVRSTPALRAKTEEAARARMALESAIQAIPLQANDSLVSELQLATAKLTRLQDAIAAENRRGQQLNELSAELQRQAQRADEFQATLRARYPDLLAPADWELLRFEARPDAVRLINGYVQASRARAAELREQGLRDTYGESAGGLASLTAALEATKKALGDDQAKAKRRGDLEKKLATAKQHEERHKRALTHAERAPERIKESQAARLDAYEAVFETMVREADALEVLYAPLRQRLATDPRLSNLSFYVYRDVNLQSWADRGEALLDLRKPPFQGRDALLETVRQEMYTSWVSGTPHDIREAMRVFTSKYASAAITALATGVTTLDLGSWLFSTEHISVRYGIRYEGVELENLSPGARGVVLLTLYLAIDESDDRPLLIDQPEENLDPKSVHMALVPFFRDATKRRQIIMVTHNANLVVNTDSDQVIVAEATRTDPANLPDVTYFAGGLEDTPIRKLVCQYLEGGEEAFRRRGRRYGLLMGLTT
jgi:energy-coupling factor transporter ATP-binding protein EcfA2